MSNKLLYIAIVAILCSSCRTTNSIQKEIRMPYTDLFYELNSPIYRENVTKDIYINFIGYSNMEYYTLVKKKKSLIIPLLLYNYSGHTYQTILGEASFSQNYREFLTEALLAECNQSTCFNLIDNTDDIAPETSYTMDVIIVKNQTTAKAAYNTSSILWTEGDHIEGYSGYVEKPATDLTLSVCLNKANETVFKKQYSVNRTLFKGQKKVIGNSYAVNDACIRYMAESLSYATRDIVADIARELHLTALLQK